MCVLEGGQFQGPHKGRYSHGKMSLWLSRSLFFTVFLCICLFREKRKEREEREREEREKGKREGRRRMNERTNKKRKICNNINYQARICIVANMI